MRMFGMRFKVIFMIVFTSLSSSSDALISLAKHRKYAERIKNYAVYFAGLVEDRTGQAEWHDVTTEDGYILSLFRIPPNSSSQNESQNGPPIYLQHGLFCTADSFFLVESEKSLAKVLSDAGYDVWIGNLRGNSYSRRHRTLSPNDREFWDFSIDHYALKDLPAMLDYILESTNQPTLTYIGVSLGTTLNMILLSNRTDFNDKINLVVHFSPVSFFKTRNLLRSILSSTNDLLELLFNNNPTELLPQSETYSYLIKKMCLQKEFTKKLCQMLLTIFVGDDHEQFFTKWDTILQNSRYIPAGISSKVLLHYGQHVKSGKFRYFDHKNDEINLQYYGQKTPPDYAINNIAAPMIYYRGGSDPLSTGENNWEFIRRLRRNITFIDRLYKNFNHFDFLTTRDVKKLVFDDLLKILSKFAKIT